MSTAFQKVSTDDHPAAPLYITIGPQCAGKTTYLRKSIPDVIDITIDDQDGVYHSLPFGVFLNPSAPEYESKTKIMLYDQSVLDRVSCPTQMEMKIILEHFTRHRKHEHQHEAETNCANSHGPGYSSLEKKLSGIAKNGSTSEGSIPEWKLQYPDDLLQDFIEAILSCDNQDNSTEQQLMFQSPNNAVDLFIPEALFNPPASAIEKAQCLLKPPPRKEFQSLQNRNYLSMPISWGNTNVRPTDYEYALKIAEEYGRPVHFIVFNALGDNPLTNVDLNMKQTQFLSAIKEMKWELPNASRKELLRRNITRLCQTGRYVNVKAIDSTLERCRNLLWAALEEISTFSTSSTTKEEQELRNENECQLKFDFDRALVRLAGFELDQDRRVKRVGTPRFIPNSNNRPGKRHEARCPPDFSRHRGNRRGIRPNQPPRIQYGTRTPLYQPYSKHNNQRQPYQDRR